MSRMTRVRDECSVLTARNTRWREDGARREGSVIMVPLGTWRRKGHEWIWREKITDVPKLGTRRLTLLGELLQEKERTARPKTICIVLPEHSMNLGSRIDCREIRVLDVSVVSRQVLGKDLIWVLAGVLEGFIPVLAPLAVQGTTPGLRITGNPARDLREDLPAVPSTELPSRSMETLVQ
jgi:hypothetical protein